MTNRRDFLKIMLSGSLISLMPNLKLYSAPTKTNNKFFLIILRGGMDGLAMVPPFADFNYKKVRSNIINSPGEIGGALNLNGFFGLHPNLGKLKSLYDNRELVIFNAVATPYLNRSHFAVQDVLENGMSKPGAKDGWLNRLVLHEAENSALSLGKEMPFILRGKSRNVSSYYPKRISKRKRDLLHEIADLYQGDSELAKPVEQFMNIDKISMKNLTNDDINADKNAAPVSELERLLFSAAKLMRSPSGANIAVFDVGGWDTHVNQGGIGGDLARKMESLSNALAKIKIFMGDEWKNSCFLTVTEFGRTVKFNGTRGTDHGTGSVALLGGGAVKGKRILGNWPGLAPNQLYQGRDLAATTDMRKIFKTIIKEHLKIDRTTIERHIFPDSSITGYFDNLF